MDCTQAWVKDEVISIQKERIQALEKENELLKEELEECAGLTDYARKERIKKCQDIMQSISNGDELCSEHMVEIYHLIHELRDRLLIEEYDMNVEVSL